MHEQTTLTAEGRARRHTMLEELTTVAQSDRIAAALKRLP